MTLTLGAVLWAKTAKAFGSRAAVLEERGFGSLSVGDHLGHFPPLPACAAIAQATEQARVGPLVLNNDFRHPSVLAREAAALADLFEGRFELGLGAGYARHEYRRAGIPYHPGMVRIARLGEAAEILGRLLKGERVTFEGDHYRVQDDSLPALTHDVPLLIGGNHPAVHAIARRTADMLNLIGLSSVKGGSEEDLSDFSATALDRQVQALAATERGLDRPLELHALVQWHELTEDRFTAARRAAAAMHIEPDLVLDSPYVLIGTADEIDAQLHRDHRRFGLTRWTIFADRPDLQPAEALAPVIALLRG
jgi:probable F420-dependent oxidoreductase